ncbi:MAG TPA: serine hydrolase [Candidatus Elarobacter sp.]
MNDLSRRRVIGATAMLALCLSAAAPAAAPAADPPDVRGELSAYVAAHPQAVVAAALVDGTRDDVAAVRGAAAPSGAADTHTRFQIGSVTKTFTATVLALMVETGDVALDDPIQRYLPAGTKAPDFHGTPITLRSLAEQTSGLPRLAAGMLNGDPANPYAAYARAQLYDDLARVTLARAPGSQYEYSNFGYTLLGQLLANRAGTSYAELVSRRILRPLGMSDTVVVGTAATRARLVAGYGPDGQPQRPWDFGELGAAGSIESDLNDMLLFLKANLEAPAGPLGRATALAQEPRTPTTPDGIQKIGLAWQTNTRSGITWHNGATGGYYAFVGFQRSSRKGVVVLANTFDPVVETLALHLLVPALIPAPAYAGAAHESSPYSGVYRLGATFAITVFKQNGRLYAQGTGQPALALRPVTGQTFAVEGVDAQVTFELDAAGNAIALTLHQLGADRRALKEPQK